jgi:hypothetical protein
MVDILGIIIALVLLSTVITIIGLYLIHLILGLFEKSPQDQDQKTTVIRKK